QIPDGYYDNAEGLSGDALKSALHNIIKNHTELSYNALRDYILKASDEDPNNSNNVILLYTGRSQSKSSFGGDPNEWNREHVWAKSHGGFGNDPPAGTDAHHIRPSDVSVNSDRSSKDFDEGGTQHSEATGCYYTSNTWEPRDAVKGDVARMMFYMSVRYEGDNSEPDLELVNAVGTSGPEFGNLATLLNWNEQDPVDEFESHRNEVIYSYQHNRNPFIDHPEYAALIWGEAVLPPQFTSEPITTVSVGQEYIYNITASDPNPNATLLFTYENGPVWFSLVNNNDWTATLSGTPTANDIGTYFVTISLSNGGTQSITQFYSLLVIPSNISSISKNAKQIIIFPQPATDYIKVQFNIVNKEQGLFKIYNSAGQLIQQHILKPENFNTHNAINIKLNNLKPGIYFYKFEQDKFQQTGKLIIK
ncbi:MAG: T9SS type A sorting domain-containing protein, partial [Chlorobi bacterium]|nr:T9SS type A sorting domain-containing protein [Chlorobiota bacterium]